MKRRRSIRLRQSPARTVPVAGRRPEDAEEAGMRRGVGTGMGIVSSIGNSTQEVLASLREAKSGISRADKHVELGFRSQVQGAPTLDPTESIDRRAMRFLGGG